MSDDAKLLFVDDEPALADGYAATFSEYDTRAVNGGRAALDHLDEEGADVVFLDRRMPGMGGEEVLEAIRERDYDCQVVMLTGVEPDAEAVELGFDEYLVKPVGGDALRETVEELTEPDADPFDDQLLDALGDSKARRCCALLVEEPRSAQELAEETGFSSPTVYRRLNTLQQAGLIESQITVDPDGGHYQTYAVVPTRIRVEIADEIALDLEHLDTPTP